MPKYILKCQIHDLLCFHDITGFNIQDERDLNQRFYYIYLRTSDYKLHASKHNIGRFFICEYPGKRFLSHNKNLDVSCRVVNVPLKIALITINIGSEIF